MVTYCLTNTNCARLNVNERPRTAIQGLAAPFPSHGKRPLGVKSQLNPAKTSCVKESAKRASRRKSEPPGQQERLLPVSWERSSRPLRGASKDEVVGVIFLRAIFLPRAKVLVAPRPSEAPAEAVALRKNNNVVRRFGRNCRFFLIERAATGGAFAAPREHRAISQTGISYQAFDA